MKSVFTLLALVIFSATLFLGARAHAQQSFQFAPSRTDVKTQTTTKTTVSGDMATQLSTISQWEQKIADKIPQSLKDKANAFDQMRIDLALKYGKLRDIAHGENTITVKGKPSKGTVAVEYNPGVWYYVYSALEFFFSHLYLFYGAILLGTFFILRIILRYFNVIV